MSEEYSKGDAFEKAFQASHQSKVGQNGRPFPSRRSIRPESDLEFVEMKYRFFPKRRVFTEFGSRLGKSRSEVLPGESSIRW